MYCYSKDKIEIPKAAEKQHYSDGKHSRLVLHHRVPEQHGNLTVTCLEPGQDRGG